MVGPSFSDDDRILASRLLKVGLVILVGVSGALVAVQGGADAPVVAASFTGGVVAGAALTWFVARNLRQIQPEGLRERRKRARERQSREPERRERDEREQRNRRR